MVDLDWVPKVDLDSMPITNPRADGASGPGGRPVAVAGELRRGGADGGGLRPLAWTAEEGAWEGIARRLLAALAEHRVNDRPGD